MAQQALGMIECKGLVAAFEAADAALKVVFGGKAKVSMFEMTKLVSGHVS